MSHAPTSGQMRGVAVSLDPLPHDLLEVVYPDADTPVVVNVRRTQRVVLFLLVLVDEQDRLCLGTHQDLALVLENSLIHSVAKLEDNNLLGLDPVLDIDTLLCQPYKTYLYLVDGSLI